jgi:agmatine deiminase
MPTPQPLLEGTPLQHGFTFPAEWAPQAATWFSWPRPEGISFPTKYHTIPANLAAIMREIVPRQLVRINVPNANYERIVREQLAEHGLSTGQLRTRVRFHHLMTNESWCRDHGPAFVVKAAKEPSPRSKAATAQPKASAIAIVDWGFNAWGGKYPPFDSDDAVPQRIADLITRGAPVDPLDPQGKYAPTDILERSRFAGVFAPAHAKGNGEALGKGLRRVVMEGGAIEVNGAGTLLTTTSCLLNKNRNPKMSKALIEQCLKDCYGQSHICWLGEGIVGDDTDGHIDDLARFLTPRTLVIAREKNRKDANYHILEENAENCRKLRDQDGHPFDIVQLPMPKAMEHKGQRLPATYLNFLFVNGALLVPTFQDRTNDAKALNILQDALPWMQVIGIDCTQLIWGLGAIHCLTQQQPA